jgi:hypothetical protein
MSTLRFRLLCETCGYVFKYSDEDVVPVECPNDAGHVVQIDKTAIVAGKGRIQILNEIMAACEPAEQLPRMLDALDKYPSFIAALDNFNYPLARSRLNKALNAADILQADYDLCDGKIPA